MRYKAGKVGRVVLARFDHGEQVVPALAGLCEKEGISSGWFFLFGAIRNGKLVAGPREASLPPDPVWQEFTEPFEIVGMGSIAAGGGFPSIHLHSSLGRGKEVLTGCRITSYNVCYTKLLRESRRGPIQLKGRKSVNESPCLP